MSGAAFHLGVELSDLGADDLIVEFKRLLDVVDVEKDAGDLGRHSNPSSGFLTGSNRPEDTPNRRSAATRA